MVVYVAIDEIALRDMGKVWFTVSSAACSPQRDDDSLPPVEQVTERSTSLQSVLSAVSAASVRIFSQFAGVAASPFRARSGASPSPAQSQASQQYSLVVLEHGP